MKVYFHFIRAKLKKGIFNSLLRLLGGSDYSFLYTHLECGQIQRVVSTGVKYNFTSLGIALHFHDSGFTDISCLLVIYFYITPP